ncbi:hypothetical protein AAFX33_12555 [Vibrio chagasii]|uniref:hypothetical protein n=1 Tax=Vibrio chagasii TaxID=170679 RepID=UPI0038CDC749
MNKTGGIQSYWNLHKSKENEAKPSSIFEVPLFTDSHITGEFRGESVPYSILNLVPWHTGSGNIAEAMMLRVEWFLNTERSYDLDTDNSSYHGGWAPDEIAALMSLTLGVRVKAGGVVREYGGYHSDPLGTPRASEKVAPTYAAKMTRPIVPNAIKTVNITNAFNFGKLHELSEENYVALIRSARMYQDALWMVESEPELAWLMLISAIETAASYWDKEIYTPAMKLKASKPELYSKLEAQGGDELCNLVAVHIEKSLGATSKFVKFCLEHLPEPPKERPRDWAQIKWSKTGFRKTLTQLYDYRSSALHGGIPFPAPLCRAPDQTETDMPPSEKGMLGLASHSLGATWSAKDLPISANTFFEFAHGVLNNWVQSSLGNKKPTSD